MEAMEACGEMVGTCVECEEDPLDIVGSGNMSSVTGISSSQTRTFVLRVSSRGPAAYDMSIVASDDEFESTFVRMS